MILTPHTIAGVAIATVIPNPVIAVPTAFVFHFLGDLVPHWDYYGDLNAEERKHSPFYLVLLTDILIGATFALAFTFYALWVLKNPLLSLNIFLCSIASVLPDAFTAPAVLMNNPPKFSKIALKVQEFFHFHAPYPWGFISQLFVAGFCLLVIANSILL